MYVCPECGESFAEQGHCPTHSAALTSAAASPLLGRTIASFRVAREIGRGATGRVYLAVHPAIGSRVAIKVLSAAASRNRRRVERFFAEARAANLVRHDGIVPVLDLLTLDDGRPCIVMEYLDGQPLSAVLARGPCPLPRLGQLMLDVLGALQACHAQRVVHRDLKPDNIHVTSLGRARLLDFGIALFQDLARQAPGSIATTTGALFGSPHYLSPEQAVGGKVDHRTDIYSAGVVLYQGATGRRPFEGNNLYDLLEQHVHATPPPPRSIQPGLPPALDQVIATAIAKRPEHRYGTAADMADAVRRALRLRTPERSPPRRAAAGSRRGTEARRGEFRRDGTPFARVSENS